MALELRQCSIPARCVFVRDQSRITKNPNSLLKIRFSSRFRFQPQLHEPLRYPIHYNSVVLAASADSSATTESTTIVEKKEWIALVANAEFMLNDVQNESLAEQLREKIRLYNEKGRKVDFFLVPEPAWLDVQFPEKGKLVGRPCVAIVSSDPVWMRFMRTRLDQVLEVKLGVISEEEALKSSGELPEFKEPEIWRAPYARYSPGWWKAFYPPKK
eukprot:g2886.t1